MKLLLQWLFTSLLILALANILPGFEVTSFGVALSAALVLGVLNVTLGFFLQVLSLPITVLTLGFFSLLINAFIFSILGNIDGVSIDNFWTALIASILVSLGTMAFKAASRSNS